MTRQPLIAALLLALARPAPGAPPPRAPSPEAAEFFERKVRPVLVEHCFRCHSAKAKKLKGKLRVDSRAALLAGGERGPALVPGSPGKSRLIEAVSYKNVDLQMPPRARLPDAVVADLSAWVKMGAPWPGSSDSSGPATPTGGFDLAGRKRAYWAWRPVRPHAPLAVRYRAWPRGPVDSFVLFALEKKGLRPAPPADRRTLVRRLTFDLTGLPPTPEEVDAFVKDHRPDAYERLVERLLASPAFGESWARHWLDLVRYAETRGHEFDFPIPNAHHYRDYVVRALNADLPYDRFVLEHLAGDLLDSPRLHPTQGFNESILGTGFWFLGEEVHSPVDVRQDEADRFDNRIDVFTKTFLGLTVGCARCHDHKFDAISTKDYYAQFGFLKSSAYRQVRFDTLDHNRTVASDLAGLRAKARPALRKALAESARPTVERLADYLLAARALSLAPPPDDKLEEVARARKLNPGRLASWARALRRAADDVDDPLHPWAKVASDPKSADATHLAELLRPLADRLRTGPGSSGKGAEVVVDYSSSTPAQWLPDGPAFGTGPVRPGDVSLGGDADRPVVSFAERAAAEYDRVWDVLAVAPGTEKEPGALGTLPVRAGRTLRTPTFRLTTGKLFYLVRGTGAAYASVNSHALIHGPLHGRLVLSIPAQGGFRWVVHDLTPYKGLHAHVEFSARPGSDFAVARVVQAEKVPGPVGPPAGALLRLLTGDDARSLESLASGYQRLFRDALGELAKGEASGIDTGETARLANWLARHPELLGEGAKTLARAARPFLLRQKALAARIQAVSRLAPAMLDGTGVDEHVFIRGSPKAPGPLVPRRFLESLSGPDPLPVARGSGRLELARQVVDPRRNPFVARVMVNRVWHHLFGRGLVASVDNFGVLGEPPTHPELLDHLADSFVREGWSLKKLVRALVLSSAYRMSSRGLPGNDRADPQDLLLHRARLRRLEGEAIRDAMLAVSGRLDRRVGGPSVPIHLTPFLEGRGKPPPGPLDGDGRRSLYLAVRRNFLSPMLLAFDTPAPSSTVGRRTVSNVPAQALILLNDPFVHQQARAWAERVLARPGTASGRVGDMYHTAFARDPTEEERAACLGFLADQARRRKLPPDDPAVWADLAHTLFNAKEFIFVR